jgi:transcriptional regulator with XRE-family HTH domain
MDYGRALRIARALAGLEQQELARLAGLDASHVSLIERGKRNPTVETLEKLSRGLKLPYHLMTLLAAEAKDLRHVDPSETRKLGEHIAKMLLTEPDESQHQPAKRRSKRRPKA